MQRTGGSVVRSTPLVLSRLSRTCAVPCKSHAALTSRQQAGARVVVGSGSGGSARRRALVAAAAGGGNPDRAEREQRKADQQIIAAFGVGLTLAALVALRLGGDAFQGGDDAAWDLSGTGGGALGGFGLGDAVGGLLWAGSLYYTSPVQLLGLFFGFFDKDRPSDWVLQRLGLAAGLDVDAFDYTAPATFQAATVGLFVASGLGLAVALSYLLGDATWSVSTGFGACVGSAMYEFGRPRRLSVGEAEALEEQWRAFAPWADGRLQRSGRCHESEIQKVLRREVPLFSRSEQGPAEGAAVATLRDLVRNWNPDATVSSQGYIKGVSLVQTGSIISSSGSDSDTFP